MFGLDHPNRQSARNVKKKEQRKTSEIHGCSEGGLVTEEGAGSDLF